MRHTLVEANGVARVLQVSRKTPFGISRKIEIIINWSPKLQAAKVDTRFTQPLHGHKADHCSRPLCPCRRATRTAEGCSHASRCQVGLLRRPFAGQRTNITCWYPGLIGCPFWRPGNPLLVITQNVILPLIKPSCTVFDIVFVVKALSHPNVGYGLCERRARRGSGGYPLAAHESSGFI